MAVDVVFCRCEGYFRHSTEDKIIWTEDLVSADREQSGPFEVICKHAISVFLLLQGAWLCKSMPRGDKNIFIPIKLVLVALIDKLR